MSFPLHTMDTAPAASRPSLEALRTAFGFTPNLIAAMATSPVLIASLVALFGKVHGGIFSEPEIQVLLLTNAVTNASAWPVAFHSTLAQQQGISASDIDAIRSRRQPGDPKVAALSALARTLIEKRGKLTEADIEDAHGAGYSREHVLEAIAVSAASTITNFTASLTKPPLEEQFRPQAWTAG